MTSEYDETCLVCCEKTKKRCASCAKAGIDLYFCSPEHQKLVWKTHKEVCGPGKANPFTWPLLSQHEADEAIKHMDESTGLLVHFPSSCSTVAKACHHLLGIPPTQLTDLIQGLTSTTTAVRLGEDRQQFLLVVVRAHEHARTAASSLINRLAPSGSINLMSQLSYQDLYSSRSEENSNDYGREPWRSRFRHYMLVYLLFVDKATRGPSKEVLNWLLRLHQRNHQLIKTEIAATHPRLAQKMLETIAQANQHMQAAGIPSFHT